MRLFRILGGLERILSAFFWSLLFSLGSISWTFLCVNKYPSTTWFLIAGGLYHQEVHSIIHLTNPLFLRQVNEKSRQWTESRGMYALRTSSKIIHLIFLYKSLYGAFSKSASQNLTLQSEGITRLFWRGGGNLSPNFWLYHISVHSDNKYLCCT